MGETRRELCGLGRSPSNSLVTSFGDAATVGCVVVIGAAILVGVVAVVGATARVGAWVPWFWMRACINP